jgi:hypothetical protein
VSPLTFLEASTPGTGGFIETPNQRLQVRHVFENFGTPEALGNVTVEDTGGQLRVADVANVVEEHQPLIGDAIVDGNDDRLLLVVEKFPGADTAEVTSGVEDALNNLKPGLVGMKFDTGCLPAGDLHHGRDRQPEACDHYRWLSPGARTRGLPVLVAHRVDKPRDDLAVSGGGGARALPAR